jgi:hypothetical protein
LLSLLHEKIVKDKIAIPIIFVNFFIVFCFLND